jgi:thiamine biosynthesis protein ThiC
MIIGSKIRNAKKVELSENAYPVLFAHVGVGDYKDIDLAIEVERNKIKGAIEAGADIICDVSMSDNIKYVHDKEGIHHETFWNKYFNDAIKYWENNN